MTNEENQLLNLLLPIGVGDRVAALGDAGSFYSIGDVGTIVNIENERHRCTVKWDLSPTVNSNCNREWCIHLNHVRRLGDTSNDY